MSSWAERKDGLEPYKEKAMGDKKPPIANTAGKRLWAKTSRLAFQAYEEKTGTDLSDQQKARMRKQKGEL